MSAASIIYKWYHDTDVVRVYRYIAHNDSCAGWGFCEGGLVIPYGVIHRTGYCLGLKSALTQRLPRRILHSLTSTRRTALTRLRQGSAPVIYRTLPRVDSLAGLGIEATVVGAAEPIELRDDDWAFQPAGHLESRGKLRPALKGVSALAGLDFGESIYDVAALGSGKPGNGIALSFKAQPRGALLLGADPDIGDDLRGPVK
jgi:hypothetical protein